MDVRSEIREFLMSRRARLSPESTGLPSYGARRVPGLRREEVAVLAGISLPYYARLERGDLSGASDTVLEALARALQLDDAERAHLFDLARAARPLAATRADDAEGQPVRPVIWEILDAITGAAAFVGNDRQDVLGANRLGYALFADVFASDARTANVARFTFLDQRAHELFVDWDGGASRVVSGLRASAGRNPNDRRLAALIDELRERSEPFRARWATHDVHGKLSGRKRLRHPLVGELELHYEQLDLPSDPRLLIFTLSAPAGSSAAASLDFLASWGAARAADADTRR